MQIQHLCKISNLESKLLPRLAKIYGNNESKIAINKLECWYIDQLFDDDDFTNDWIPNDYNNCDGIHIFIKELTHLNKKLKPLLFDNNKNKKILYSWICYWLHSQKIDKPTINIPLYSSYQSEHSQATYLHPNEKCENVSSCPIMNNISSILYRYHLFLQQQARQDITFEIKQNESPQSEKHKKICKKIRNGKFLDIHRSVYGELLDNDYTNVNLVNDFNHLLECHSSEFEDIYNILVHKIYNDKPCDSTKCSLLRRNQRDKTRTHKNLYLDISDDGGVLLQEVLDRIHCYYLHKTISHEEIKTNDHPSSEHDIHAKRTEIKEDKEVLFDLICLCCVLRLVIGNTLKYHIGWC